MKNTFGNALCVTLFGESHGNAVGAVLDGLPAGLLIDVEYINKKLSQRRSSPDISTPRREADEFKILSGVFNGRTTGTPLCLVIENTDTHSGDYSELSSKARPGHADYTANVKYRGFQDYRGGGHFSGRITAPLVGVGAIALSALKNKNIFIGTHLLNCAGVSDLPFSDLKEEVRLLDEKSFPVINDFSGDAMIEKIKRIKKSGDSVGGVLETAVLGVPAGVGEPWFDSLESIISHGVFSIPGVKGVEFGAGFSSAKLFGSEMNDEFFVKDGAVFSRTNNNGGINGGISNGMPIVFKTAVKPTPSIGIHQNTVDFKQMENTELLVKGRHDPCIAHRARAVVDAVTALAVCDMLILKYGTDWLAE